MAAASADLGTTNSDLATLGADLGSATPPAPQAPWKIENSGTTTDLTAVWGSGAHDVYAIGAGGTILHSTGAGDWTRQDAGTTGARLSKR